ncbi:MAG: hypothetical protein SGPRY_010998, partial [Prymnesium sp.]
QGPTPHTGGKRSRTQSEREGAKQEGREAQEGGNRRGMVELAPGQRVGPIRGVVAAHASWHGVLLTTADASLLLPWPSLSPFPPLESSGHVEQARLMRLDSLGGRRVSRAHDVTNAAISLTKEGTDLTPCTPPHALHPTLFTSLAGAGRPALLLADEQGGVCCVSSHGPLASPQVDEASHPALLAVAELGEPLVDILLVSRTLRDTADSPSPVNAGSAVNMIALVGCRGKLLLISAAEGGGLSRQVWQQPLATVCAACALPSSQLLLTAADGAHLLQLPPATSKQAAGPHDPDETASPPDPSWLYGESGKRESCDALVAAMRRPLPSQLLALAGPIVCTRLVPSTSGVSDSLDETRARVLVLSVQGKLSAVEIHRRSADDANTDDSSTPASKACATAERDYTAAYNELCVREQLRCIGEGSSALDALRQRLKREEEGLQHTIDAKHCMRMFRSCEHTLSFTERGRMQVRVRALVQVRVWMKGWLRVKVMMRQTK